MGKAVPQASDVNILVAIPWRPQSTRTPAKNAVIRWYHRNLPEADVRLVDSPHNGVFNPAAARNACARAGEDYGVIVINDADTIPEIDPLREAITDCQDTGRVHLPYHEYRTLGPAGTNQYLLDGRALKSCRYTAVPEAASGTLVLTPEVWWHVGGQDERFKGWGYEDAAWAIAHTTLLGAMPRHPGRVYALHHRAAARRTPQVKENAALCYRYIEARSDPLAMRAILDEWEW